MAYTSPVSPAVGDALKASWGQTVKTDLDDHEARLLGVETNVLANGSYEVVDASGEPVKWDLQDLGSSGSEGSHDVDDAADSSANVRHGEKSLRMTANSSGGYVEATSEALTPVAVGRRMDVEFLLDCSVVDVNVDVDILWYDEDGNTNGTTSVYAEDAANPTDWEYRRLGALPLAGSAFAKLRLRGGESGGSTDGTVWFDGVKMEPGRRFSPVALANALTDPQGGGVYSLATHLGTEWPSAVLLQITCSGDGFGAAGSVVVQSWNGSAWVTSGSLTTNDPNGTATNSVIAHVRLNDAREFKTVSSGDGVSLVGVIP